MPRIIIKEPDQKPQPYRLKINRIVTKIGRAKDNDILITDGSSSTYHCKIKRVEGGFILVDSDSTNGIKSKGTRYSVIDLKDGETVQIGDDIDLKFSLSEEEIEELSSEDFESQQKASFPKSKKPKKEELQDSDDDEELDDEEEAEEEKPTPKKKPSKKTKSKKQRELDEDEDDLDHDEDESDENEDDLDEDEDTRSKSKKKSRRSKPSSSKDKNKDSDRKRDERPRRQQQEKSNSSLSFVIFIILAVLCFIAGLAIRHYLDHEMFIFTK